MTAEGTSTINKLVELFHLSISKGEKVTLSMESKDRKDISISNPSGSPVGSAGSWTPPDPRSPWTWPPPPRPWPNLARSQLKRDQKRKGAFLAKKSAPSVDVKREVITEADKATILDPVDEISLTEISVKPQCDIKLWKIVRKLKNPTRKSWTPVDPEADNQFMWEQVNERDEKFDMEEIGDGSTYSKNHIEFWGTWKVKREEANEEFLKNLNN